MSALIAVGAATAAVAIAFGLAWVLVAIPLGRRIADLEQRQRELRRTLAQVEQRVAEAAPPPPPAPRAWPPAAVAPLPSPDPLVPIAPPAAPRMPDRTIAVRDRVTRYRELLAARARPRQLQDVIDEDGSPHALGYDATTRTLSVAAFDPDDPGQLLVAIAAPEPGAFVVLPTYNYLDSFRLAFSIPVQNPELIRHLFDFDQDDGGQLRLADPALIRIDEGGGVQKIRAGRMGGYASGA